MTYLRIVKYMYFILKISSFFIPKIRRGDALHNLDIINNNSSHAVLLAFIFVMRLSRA